MLRRIRGCSKPVFEMPPEDKEKRHQGENHAGQPEIQHEHGPNNKDCVAGGLESIWYEARSQFGHLIDVLFHAVEPLAHGCHFVEVRREPVHLLQDSESNAENKILHCAGIQQRT